jgi:hypothetical protein
VKLTFGAATSFDNSLAEPFELSLKKGWNQIGNPFAHTIQWSELLALPENSNAPIGKLLTYDNQSISLAESDQLKMWEGGFVFADDDTQLTFPVTLSAGTTGARSSAAVNRDADLTSGWFVPIQIVQDGLVSNLSGVGMHPLALEGKDRWDLCTPPSIGRYVVFQSTLSNYEFPLSRSIVASGNAYQWSFSLSASEKSAVQLKWDPSRINQLDGQLILRDWQKNTIINMSAVDSYLATPSSSFAIYYDIEKKFTEKTVVLGLPYPNPFHETTIIPFDYTDTPTVQSKASLIITDISGLEITRLTSDDGGSAVQSILWNGRNAAGNPVQSGMYLYRLSVSDAAGTSLYTGKIIKL